MFSFKQIHSETLKHQEVRSLKIVFVSFLSKEVFVFENNIENITLIGEKGIMF